ncbi:hypothetical protein WA158_002165 [Blastocystis sp. Blastoise]
MYFLIWGWNWITLTQTRISIVTLWAILLLILLLSLPCLQILDAPLIIIRKFFHFLCVFLFVPAVLYDNELIYIAISVAFALFVYVELLRILSPPPFSFLHPLLTSFTDNRDNGYLILTHMSLLLGCAVPIWALEYFTNIPLEQRTVLRSSGIVVLGFGDSFAAIIGSLLGKIKIMNTHKTIEGYLGFTISLFLALLFIELEVSREISYASIMKFSFISVMSGLCELFVKDVDNYILPLYILNLFLAIQTKI